MFLNKSQIRSFIKIKTVCHESCGLNSWLGRKEGCGTWVDEVTFRWLLKVLSFLPLFILLWLLDPWKGCWNPESEGLTREVVSSLCCLHNHLDGHGFGITRGFQIVGSRVMGNISLPLLFSFSSRTCLDGLATNLQMFSFSNKRNFVANLVLSIFFFLFRCSITYFETWLWLVNTQHNMQIMYYRIVRLKPI